MAEQADVTRTIRLPADLDDLVKASAESDRRSINSQWIVLLEEAIKARADRQREAA